MKNGIKFESRAARLAKKLGYTHIAAVVKTHYSSSYYNVNAVDHVISSGKWSRCGNNGCYAVGIIASDIDWGKTITRVDLHRKLREAEKAA